MKHAGRLTVTDHFRKALREVRDRTLTQAAEAAHAEISRAEERGRREAFAALGEVLVKALVPALVGRVPPGATVEHVEHVEPPPITPADPLATLLKSLPPETAEDRLHAESARLGLSGQLRHVKAYEAEEYERLLADVADLWELERITKADRSHLVRKVIRNRLGHRQVVWVRPEEGEEPQRGASRGQADHEGREEGGQAKLTREQAHESRTLVAKAVQDPNSLNPEQLRELGRHVNAITKEEAKGLLRVLGQKLSGDQMAVAQRLVDAVRAGRQKGRGVGDALERAGTKVSGQYGVWGQAVGGTGGKPEATREDFPKRGLSPDEAAKARADAEAAKQPAGEAVAQEDKPTGQTDKPNFAAMTPDEVDAHMGALKGKEYGDALRDMPSDVAKKYLERKTAADRYARRSRAGGKAATTRARRAGELEAKLSTETGKRLHAAEQAVKHLGERYKAGGNVTDAMFDRAQRELENASLAHNLYTTHQNPDVVTQRRNDELPNLDLSKGPDPVEATRERNTIPWTVSAHGGEPVVISGARLEDTSGGQRVVRLYGISPGQMKGDSQTSVRGSEMGSLLVHFDAGNPDESRRARRLVHQIAHGKAQDMTIAEMQSLIKGENANTAQPPAPADLPAPPAADAPTPAEPKPAADQPAPKTRDQLTYLPKDPKRLTIDQADQALKDLGYTNMRRVGGDSGHPDDAGVLAGTGPDGREVELSPAQVKVALYGESALPVASRIGADSIPLLFNGIGRGRILGHARVQGNRVVSWRVKNPDGGDDLILSDDEVRQALVDAGVARSGKPATRKA